MKMNEITNLLILMMLKIWLIFPVEHKTTLLLLQKLKWTETNSVKYPLQQ